jgi:hypothetical protein
MYLLNFIFYSVASEDDGLISPAEIAVLDSLMNGGEALSLKVRMKPGTWKNWNFYTLEFIFRLISFLIFRILILLSPQLHISICLSMILE